MNNLRNSIWRGLFALVLGLIMVIFPHAALNYLVIVVGIAFLVFGGINIGIYVSRLRSGFKSNSFPIWGILCLILGLLLVIAPSFFLSFLMIILGALLVIAGVTQLSDIAVAQRDGIPIRWVMYIFPVLILAAGLVVVFNPFDSAKTLMIFFGIAAIISGIVDIADEMMIRSALKGRGTV